MSVSTSALTKISLKNPLDYLPRVRRIITCLADSAGMSHQETDRAMELLVEACANAETHDANDVYGMVTIAIDVSDTSIVASVLNSAQELHV